MPRYCFLYFRQSYPLLRNVRPSMRGVTTFSEQVDELLAIKDPKRRADTLRLILELDDRNCLFEMKREISEAVLTVYKSAHSEGLRLMAAVVLDSLHDPVALARMLELANSTDSDMLRRVTLALINSER